MRLLLSFQQVLISLHHHSVFHLLSRFGFVKLFIFQIWFIKMLLDVSNFSTALKPFTFFVRLWFMSVCSSCVRLSQVTPHPLSISHRMYSAQVFIVPGVFGSKRAARLIVLRNMV